jgi:hypothetical protein
MGGWQDDDWISAVGFLARLLSARVLMVVL